MDEVNMDEVNMDEVNMDEVNMDEGNVDEVNVDEVNMDEVNMDEVNMDEVNVDEVNMDEVNVDEVSAVNKVNEVAPEVSGVKEVMQLDGLTMMKTKEQSRCANWDPGEVVNAKEQIEMLDVAEVAILMKDNNKVGLRLFNMKVEVMQRGDVTT